MSDQPTNRRVSDGVAVALMEQVRHMFESHVREENEKYDAIRDELRSTREASERRHEDLVHRHEQMSQSTMTVITQQNQTVQEIHKLFKAAFPEGNVEAHRLAHEQWIKKAEKEEEFWLDIKKKVVGWGVAAVLGWVGIVLWAAFVQGPVK